MSSRLDDNHLTISSEIIRLQLQPGDIFCCTQLNVDSNIPHEENQFYYMLLEDIMNIEKPGIACCAVMSLGNSRVFISNISGFLKSWTVTKIA